MEIDKAKLLGAVALLVLLSHPSFYVLLVLDSAAVLTVESIARVANLAIL